MGATERANSFWVDGEGQAIVVKRLEGTIETHNGLRYIWVRNELGSLYLKSLGPQIGYHLVPRYTIQEYAAQARKMAEEHAAALSPEIRSMIGREVALAGMFDMAPAPRPMSDEPSSYAVFL